MHRSAALCLAAAFFAGQPALASDYTEYGTSGDWSVLIDAEKGNGCFVQKEFEDGTLIQMGYWPSREGGFFGAYNAAWAADRTAEDGDKAMVKFDFPDKRFKGESEAHTLDGTPGAFVFFDNPNVPDEIAKNTEMAIQTENRPDIPVNLKGTSNAIKAARECQAKQAE
ncbi:hypothetical protein OU789_16445 [Halocynthiibacter sp. C4]|uniref:hypothetical protein n=1 Tax=Halocynthiibacter sp. C4 TaxID=2992758 RepID=UPI00237B11D9|nr:hypothetical protein [Halocynthiibacter sp. C4]MDE0591530.1 hypothetical protein [Halocynthiibacter sp. C4]